MKSSICEVFAKAFIVFLSLELGACDGKKTNEKSLATQVAVRVNGDEITVHQVNFLVARSGAVSEDQAEKAREEVLNKLIDQQLLVQKAVENKLERDPNIILALEMAKRQILAQAYLERITHNVAKPTAKEIEDFYASHPDLFAKRRLYKFDQIAVDLTPQNRAAIEQQVAQAVDFERLSQWLRAQNIAFTAQMLVQAAEQLPLEKLADFGRLGVGQSLAMTVDNKLQVFRLVEFKEDPVDQAKASPAIEVYLVNAKRKELAEQELKKLKQAARIEYPGALPTEQEGEKSQDESKDKKSEDEKKEFLEKGVQGIR